MSIDEAAYVYGGARALVQLHERHLTGFVEAWKRASAAGFQPPPGRDPRTESLDALLRHVLGAARHYMVWICENLKLADPPIEPVPDDVSDDPDGYLAHLLSKWDGPLHDLDEKTADLSVFPSAWGVDYCIDAMLEHAVMHPIRHALQLERAVSAHMDNRV